jgi:hypothetical protein
MNTRKTIPTDPTAVVETLDPAAILARLEDLDREARALRVLLRAARARHGGRHAVRSRGNRNASAQKEAGCE